MKKNDMNSLFSEAMKLMMDILKDDVEGNGNADMSIDDIVDKILGEKPKKEEKAKPADEKPAVKKESPKKPVKPAVGFNTYKKPNSKVDPTKDDFHKITIGYNNSNKMDVVVEIDNANNIMDASLAIVEAAARIAGEASGVTPKEDFISLISTSFSEELATLLMKVLFSNEFDDIEEE